MKKIIAALMATVLVLALAACATPTTTTPGAGTTTGAGDAPAANLDITVAVLDGGLGGLPVWIAEHKGWFADAGLNVNRIGFTNGPVQMEAIDSWDVGLTGIGGILSGTINFGAVIIGIINTDDGTQYIWARPDSPAVLAGQGNNTLHPGIYGDAESWRQMRINSTFGTVMHLLVLQTLSGFGLTADDVQISWMDMPTANAALLAGEGDAASTSGDMSFMEDKENFVAASSGNMTQLGLRSAIMGNPNAMQDPATREATLLFMRVFFETIDWMHANPAETAEHLISWGDFAGRTWDTRVANLYIEADEYYTLARNYHEMNTPAGSGGDYTLAHEPILGILRFFIENEIYQAGDDDIFLSPQFFDPSFINELQPRS